MQTAAGLETAHAPPPARIEFLGVEFLGRGGEYFRIWIVNVALTLATLGIYSAWAKVRREQYFHRNSRLAGATFDYDARAISILRGRILAAALLVAFQLGSQVSPVVAAAGAVALALAVPWMVCAALRFRLHHTLHRGLRFSFRGRYGESARTFLLWPLAGGATFGVLYPVALQRQQRFLYGRSAFGGVGFESTIPVGGVYGAFFGSLGLLAALLALAGGVALGSGALRGEGAAPTEAVVAIAAPIAIGIVALVAAGAYFQVRMHNLAWTHLRLGSHRFASDQTVRSFLTLQLGNLLGMLLTLGLFRPWAAVRAVRYRAAHTWLIPGESLDVFAAGAGTDETAAADEIAELFGFDVGF
jgi:uncharacterized membrane protein YjgN (DUF898 family)